jgi:hypothetical protein
LANTHPISNEEIAKRSRSKKDWTALTVDEIVSNKVKNNYH